MNYRTVTIIVAAGSEEVFAFLSNNENLPLWATEFCQGIRREGPHWKVSTSQGELFFSITAHRETGVIDMFAGPVLDAMSVFPVRVQQMPQGTGVSFSFAQSPDISDELYERQYCSLLIEVRGLIARFGGGTLHAAENSAPFSPNIVTARMRETVQFYVEQLGFRSRLESEDYVHLEGPGGVQFGLLRAELEEPPAALKVATTGMGFWLSLDVSDADAEYARLAAAGVDIVVAPVDKPWGERHFAVRDPNGVLIYIAHKIVLPAETPEAFMAEI